MDSARDKYKLSTIRSLIESIDSGTSFTGEDRPAEEGEFGVLKVSAVSYGSFEPEENKALPRTIDITTRAVTPRKHDIIMSRSNGSLQYVGASAFVEEDYPRLLLPDTLWRLSIRSGSDTNPKWLWYYFSSTEFRRSLEAAAIGTVGMKKISKRSLFSLPVRVPPRYDQDAIVNVLDTWTVAESHVAHLIAAKVRFKLGLMQQLLTGKRRFPEFVKTFESVNTPVGPRPSDWPCCHVGEFAEEVKETNGTDIPVLSCTKYDGLVDSLEYFGKQVFSKNTSKYKVVRRNQFAYATNHIEEGSIGALLDKDAGLVSPMYTVFKTNDNIHVPFLYALFKTEAYRRTFQQSTSASVNRRGSLRWRQFALIRVALPSIGEQRKISEVLAAADDEIDALRKQLDALKQQKKGLMQQLLTGQIQVGGAV